MRLTTFVLMALGSYVLTYLVTTASFPPAARLRAFFLKRWGPEWGEVWTCPYCMGLWCSGLVLAGTHALALIPLPRPEVFALWLPLWGAQCLLNALDSHIG